LVPLYPLSPVWQMLAIFVCLFALPALRPLSAGLSKDHAMVLRLALPALQACLPVTVSQAMGACMAWNSPGR